MTDKAPTLFLDFDGVLHPAPVWLLPDGSVDLGRADTVELDIDAGVTGRALFDRAGALAAALEGLEVRIVLSTSWVIELGFAHARARLPASFAQRLVGATWPAGAEDADRWAWGHLSRWQQIRRYARRRQLTRWMAIDDDAYGWQDAERHRLVETRPYLGATDQDLLELVRRLRLIRNA